MTGIESVEDGLLRYCEVMKEPGFAREGGMILRSVGEHLRSLLSETDRCVLAFPSLVVRPEIRTACLAVVLEDRMLVLWQIGMIRKKTSSTAVHRSAISDVSWGPGKSHGTAGATLLRVSHPDGALQLALPVERADLAGQLIKEALLT